MDTDQDKAELAMNTFERPFERMDAMKRPFSRAGAYTMPHRCD